MNSEHEDLGLSGSCAAQKNNSPSGYLCGSVEAMVQYLAVHLLPHEYLFYRIYPIDTKKNPEDVDRKMTTLYDTQVSRKIRQRRKAAKDHRGHAVANVRYLRVQGEQWFILIAQNGRHAFHKEQRGTNPKKSLINDVRDIPIKVGGYSIGYYFYPRMAGGKGLWKVSVRIAANTYSDLLKVIKTKGHFHRDLHFWINWFRELPYREWGGVLKQKYSLLKMVNGIRLSKGWPPVDRGAAISWQRKSVKVFVK